MKTRKRKPSRAAAARRKTPALFVYGSLLHKKYWRRALGPKEAARIKLVAARAPGWRRWWTGVRRNYGGAVLNMKRATGYAMWGALVEGLSAEAWARLDAQERSHLPRQRVLVVTARGRRVAADCYRQRIRGAEGRPAADYVAAVRAGARRLGTAASRDVEADIARVMAKLEARESRRRSG